MLGSKAQGNRCSKDICKGAVEDICILKTTHTTHVSEYYRQNLSCILINSHYTDDKIMVLDIVRVDKTWSMKNIHIYSSDYTKTYKINHEWQVHKGVLDGRSLQGALVLCGGFSEFFQLLSTWDCTNVAVDPLLTHCLASRGFSWIGDTPNIDLTMYAQLVQSKAWIWTHTLLELILLNLIYMTKF